MATNKDFSLLGDGVQEFQEGVENVNVVLGRKIRLYPFVKASGFVRLSEMGERHLNNDPSNQKSDVLLQTGNEPITLYGQGSVNFVVQNDGITIKKVLNPNIDELYKEVIVLSITYDNNSKEIINWNGSDYQVFTHSRTITCYSKDGLPSIEAMDDMLYIVLDSANYVGGEQILKITSITPRGNQANGEAEGCEITLQEVNLDFAHSGKDLLTFPQFAPMGGNFAFPKEIYNVNTKEIQTIYDGSMWNNDSGVVSLQIGFMGGTLFNSCKVIGRPKDNKYIQPPRLLFIGEMLNPIGSNLDVHGVENLSFYALMGAIPRNTSVWRSWRAGGNSQITNTMGNKTWYGGLDIGENSNGTHITKTNGQDTGWSVGMVSDDAKAPLIDGENNLAVYTLNSPNFVFDAYDLENISNPYYEYDCEAELYCGTNDKATTPTIKLGTGINVRDLLNCNAIAYQSMEMLPLTYSDLIRFSFSDIPLFGKLLNFFLGGINPTGLTGQKGIPRRTICGILPIETFRMGTMNIGSGGEAGIVNQYLQYQVFSDNINDYTSVGNKQMICGFRFSFTDRIHLEYTPNNIKQNNPDGIGKNGDGNTMYLGQIGYYETPDSQIMKAFEDDNGKPGTPLINGTYNVDGKIIAPKKPLQKGEIDGISYKSIGSSEVRLTGYDLDHSTNPISIGENRHQTNAKFKNDMTLGTNHIKLNFIDQYNTIGKVKGPMEVIPPNAGETTIGPILNSKDGIILQDEIVIDNWKSRVGDIKKDEPDNKDFVICSGGHGDAGQDDQRYSGSQYFLKFQYFAPKIIETKMNFLQRQNSTDPQYNFTTGKELFAVQGKNGQYLLKSINIPIKIIKKFYDNSGKYIPNEDVVLSGTQFSPTANELIFPYEYFKDNGDGTYSLFAYGGEMTKEIDGETYVDMSTGEDNYGKIRRLDLSNFPLSYKHTEYSTNDDEHLSIGGMAYKSTFSGSVHSGAGSGYTNFAGSRGNKFRETTHDERDMGLGNKGHIYTCHQFEETALQEGIDGKYPHFTLIGGQSGHPVAGESTGITIGYVDLRAYVCVKLYQDGNDMVVSIKTFFIRNAILHKVFNTAGGIWNDIGLLQLDGTDGGQSTGGVGGDGASHITNDDGHHYRAFQYSPVFAIENRGDNGNIAIGQQESCFAVFNFSISF